MLIRSQNKSVLVDISNMLITIEEQAAMPVWHVLIHGAQNPNEIHGYTAQNFVYQMPEK